METIEGRVAASSAAPMAMIATINSRLARKLPVDVRSQPIAAGLEKPPSAPIVLISAMPPAAAGPFRQADGMAQNTV
ncbi:hypothetical protein BGV70_24690 [Burkholderia ubonensis]|nr:hypothetical protein WJ29_22330 [Burkholderia ubonensis]OJA63209.1 hypothetical protein BGV70_24690 [Burkholderia ubonensis]